MARHRVRAEGVPRTQAGSQNRPPPASVHADARRILRALRLLAASPQVYGIGPATTNKTEPRVGRRACVSAHSYAVELFYIPASGRCAFAVSARRQLLDCNGRWSGTRVAASLVTSWPNRRPTVSGKELRMN